MHRSITAAAVTVAASIPATFAAVFFYILLLPRETWFDALRAVLVFGLGPARLGLVVAAPIAAILAVVSGRITRLPFAALALTAASIGGVLLGYWSTLNSPHVSPRIAMALCGVTWLATAAALLVLSQRKAAP